MRTIFHPTWLSHTGMHTATFSGNALSSHAQYSSITPHIPFLRSIPHAPAIDASKHVKQVKRIRNRFPRLLFRGTNR